MICYCCISVSVTENNNLSSPLISLKGEGWACLEFWRAQTGSTLLLLFLHTFVVFINKIIVILIVIVIVICYRA